MDIFFLGRSDILGYLYADQIKYLFLPKFSEAENVSVHTKYLLYLISKDISGKIKLSFSDEVKSDDRAILSLRCTAGVLLVELA